MATYKETVETNGRKVLAGESGADEYLMSDAHYAQTQANSARYAELDAQWQAAKAAGQEDKALDIQKQQEALHRENEAIRAKYGYLGGDTGGGYITLGSLGLTTNSKKSGGSGSGGSSTGISPSTAYGSNADAQRAQLEQWKQQATQAAQAKIDYNVSTNTKELERALAEAQPQFQEQAESVARDERQAMDNSALYAELRGDRGGIGQSQYNEIQAAAAQNRLAVQQAQTKLSTDTARQIEDLRAQGEFAKADAALQISQQYLQQLMSLEQWAAEYDLSAAQFEASLQQWEAEYQISMQKLQSSIAQNNASLSYDYAALTQNRDTAASSQLASMGKALMQAGIMPTGSQLAAMGITEEQARQYVMTVQLKNGG